MGITIEDVQKLLSIPTQFTESDAMATEFIFLTYQSDKPEYLRRKQALVDRYIDRAEQAQEDALMAAKILLGMQ